MSESNHESSSSIHSRSHEASESRPQCQEGDKSKDEDEEGDVCLRDISREHAREDENEHFHSPNRVKSFYSKHFEDSWGREFLSWGFSLLVVLAIVFILKIYDNRPQTDWSGAITLSSAISLLNTVAKLGFASATTSALGQLRWNWYDVPRPLSDWSAFESASRGQTFGSFGLLRKLHIRHLASVGAFISLSSIFFSSLTLQAISNPSRLAVTGTARIPRTFRYSSPHTRTFRLNALSQSYISATDNTVLAAVAFAAYNGSDMLEPSFNIQPECPTGSCRYDLYDTLAACSECFNVDTDIQQRSRGSEQYFELPLSANGSIGPLITGSLYDSNDVSPIYTHLNVSANILANRPVNVFNLTAMYTNYTATGNESSPYRAIATRAMRCGVFMCVKTMNSSVINGTLTEQVRAIHTIDVQSPGAGNNGVYLFPLPSNVTSNGSQLIINQDSLNVLGQSLANLYTGSSIIAAGLMSQESSNTSYGFGYTSSVMQGLSSNGTINIAQSVENIAIVMTNMIRAQGNKTDFVTGLSYSQQTYTSINWVWIIYPAGLELIVLLFLLGTIWKTRISRAQSVWKSNPIALLFHGLEAQGRALEKVAEIKSLSEMTTVAGKIKVRLDRKGPSTNLVDATQQK